MGPYKISQDFGNYSYHIELPSSPCQRGIHNIFHSSLLCIHVPNNDQLFPGCLDEQIPELGGTTREWTIDKILSHQGSHSDAKFEVLWTSGDKTWLPYSEIAHLHVLTDYFKILGINDITQLTDNNIRDALDDDEPDLAAGCVLVCICRPNKNCPVHQDMWGQQSTPMMARSMPYNGVTSTRKQPHHCPIRLPPVIPLTDHYQRTWSWYSSVGPSRVIRPDVPGLRDRKRRQSCTKDTAPNYALNNRCSCEQ